MQLGILPILGIIFIVLKLCDLIYWSWAWVLLPFYGGFALYILLTLGVIFALEIGERRKRHAAEDYITRNMEAETCP